MTEQNVLLNAATAYMNLIRDAAILDLQRRNVEVLQEQLRQTRDRFNVGEVTRTDVAQSESRLAAGRSQVLTAKSNYTTSRATYRPDHRRRAGQARAGEPVDRFSPQTLAGAIAAGRRDNPAVAAAMFGVDVALLQVKINEGALYPTVTGAGSVQQNWEVSPTILQQFNASLRRPALRSDLSGRRGILDHPPSQGDAGAAAHRSRDRARPGAANVVQTWGQLEAAKAQIQATQAQVNAAEIALNGVREEARVGQRTTLDVLNAQQELVNARVALVTAQRDRVVASYALLAAVGGCRRRCWGSRLRSTIRSSTTSRCATPGSACARQTAADADSL